MTARNACATFTKLCDDAANASAANFAYATTILPPPCARPTESYARLYMPDGELGELRRDDVDA
jgi:hypothetical protein